MFTHVIACMCVAGGRGWCRIRLQSQPEAVGVSYAEYFAVEALACTKSPKIECAMINPSPSQMLCSGCGVIHYYLYLLEAG